MAIFADSEHFYAVFRDLFERLAGDEATPVDSLLKSGLAFRFQCHDPDATLGIDARQRPLRVGYGDEVGRADLDIRVAADDLDRIMRGELPLRKAVGRKSLKVKGPAWKTMALADLFQHAQALYPSIAAAHERAARDETIQR